MIGSRQSNATQSVGFSPAAVFLNEAPFLVLCSGTFVVAGLRYGSREVLE
ncbi:MAG: hypothetical protein ACUVTO_05850 [Candidatus Caldatribacteriaceae bacterium]